MHSTGSTNTFLLGRFAEAFLGDFKIDSSKEKTSDDFFCAILKASTTALGLKVACILCKNDDAWHPYDSIGIENNKFSSLIENCELNDILKEHYDSYFTNPQKIGGVFSFSYDVFRKILMIPFSFGNKKLCALYFINEKTSSNLDENPYVGGQLVFIRKFFESAPTNSLTLINIWKEVFFAGSREALLERVKDFCNTQEKFEKYGFFDLILATGIDVETQLKILPHNRTTSFQSADTEFEKISSDPKYTTTAFPFIALSLSRRDIFNEHKNSYINEDFISGTFEKILKVNASKKINNYFKENLKFTNAVFDQSKSETFSDFLFDKYFDIEQLRTYLFLIYYSSLTQEEVINTERISAVDDIYNDKLTQNLLELLKNYLVHWSKLEEDGLIITSEWLFLWFGIKMLQSSIFFKDLRGKYSPGFRAQFYQNFACYYLYLLFLMRNLGEPALFRFSDVPDGFETFIAASLFLMAEYTHQEEGLNITIPLHSVLQDIWSKEAILYSVREGYRDHFHHVWNVCLVGMVLIDAGLLEKLSPKIDYADKKCSQKTLCRYLKNRNLKVACGNEASRKKIRRNWIIAGLLHDVGYSLDLNRHLLDHLQIFSNVPHIKDYSNNIGGYLKEQEHDLANIMQKNYAFYQGERLDHGIISAEYVTHLAHVKKTDSTLHDEWREEIQMAHDAIAKHNLKDVPIAPQENPLAFLLLLCDHLQEWDRPRLAGSKIRRSLSVHFLRPRQGQSGGHDIVRYLKTNLQWENNKVSMKEGDNCLKLNLVYKNAEEEKFEPAMIWCQNHVDFQSIDLKKFSKDLTIELSLDHPVSPDLGQIARTEMQLFEDYCREDDERAHLVKWCSPIKNNTSYLHCEKKEFERYTWTFARGSSLPPIDHIPSGLYQGFSVWKKRVIRRLKNMLNK